MLKQFQPVLAAVYCIFLAFDFCFFLLHRLCVRFLVVCFTLCASLCCCVHGDIKFTNTSQPIRDQNDVYDVFSDVCFVSYVLTREPEIKANLVYVLFRVCGQPKVSYLAWRD